MRPFDEAYSALVTSSAAHAERACAELQVEVLDRINQGKAAIRADGVVPLSREFQTRLNQVTADTVAWLIVEAYDRGHAAGMGEGTMLAALTKLQADERANTLVNA